MWRAARGGKGDSRLSLVFSLCRQRRCRAVQTPVISHRCAANTSPKPESTEDSVPLQEMETQPRPNLGDKPGGLTGMSLLSQPGWFLVKNTPS